MTHPKQPSTPPPNEAVEPDAGAALSSEQLHAVATQLKNDYERERLVERARADVETLVAVATKLLKCQPPEASKAVVATTDALARLVAALLAAQGIAGPGASEEVPKDHRVVLRDFLASAGRNPLPWITLAQVLGPRNRQGPPLWARLARSGAEPDRPEQPSSLSFSQLLALDMEIVEKSRGKTRNHFGNLLYHYLSQLSRQVRARESSRDLGTAILQNRLRLG